MRCDRLVHVLRSGARKMILVSLRSERFHVETPRPKPSTRNDKQTKRKAIPKKPSSLIESRAERNLHIMHCTSIFFGGSFVFMILQHYATEEDFEKLICGCYLHMLVFVYRRLGLKTPGRLHVLLFMYGLVLVLHPKFLGFNCLLCHELHGPFIY